MSFIEDVEKQYELMYGGAQNNGSNVDENLFKVNDKLREENDKLRKKNDKLRQNGIEYIRLYEESNKIQSKTLDNFKKYQQELLIKLNLINTILNEK
tara:strand:+ start:802 stop:1092 length:291 start_codon:yes stop_codon:yes gene_type:complete